MATNNRVNLIVPSGTAASRFELNNPILMLSGNDVRVGFGSTGNVLDGGLTFDGPIVNIGGVNVGGQEVLRSGLYKVFSSVTLNRSNTANFIEYEVSIRINGVVQAINSSSIDMLSASQDFNMGFSNPVEWVGNLVAGDRIEVYISQVNDDGDTMTTTTQSKENYLNIYRIGE